MKKFKISKIFKKKKREIFKKGLRTRGIGLVLLRFLSKEIQNFQFLEKIQFFKKKSSIKNFNSMKKFKISTIFKKRKREIFKKGLRTRGIGLVLLRFLSKEIRNFQFLEKIQFFKKKKKIINQKFQFHEKIQDFQNFQKRKKKEKEKKKEIFKKSLRTRGNGLVLLRLL